MSATNGGLRSRRIIVPSVDTGTNAPTRTAEQTQSTSTQTPPGPKPYVHPVGFTTNVENGAAFGVPSATARALKQNENRLAESADSATIPIVETPPTAPTNTLSAPASAITAPVKTTKDDSGVQSRDPVNSAILINANSQPGSLVKPRDNVLDQFASYTYNIGWYLLTPAQFTEFTRNSKTDISKWSLLVQSGGASIGQNAETQSGVNSGQDTPVNGPLTKLSTPNRNKYFILDYYLDDIVIKCIPIGGGANQNTELSFKVSEPNGITLLPNLQYAVRDVIPGGFPKQAHYCLVIKFYGWDINGTLITDPTRDTGTPGATPNISNALVTRYYPFNIKDFNFKVSSKSVLYEITGIPVPYAKASSTAIGTIPANYELSGETVEQILSSTQSGFSGVVKNFSDLAALAGAGRESTNSPSPPTNQSGGAVKADVGSFDPSTNII
jgi:hypothetical protein